MADEAAGYLVARGAVGCAVAQAHKPGARRPSVVSLEAYFDRVTPSELARMDRAMRAAGMVSGASRRPRAARIADPGWSTIWMKRFRPLRIGRRWLILPPWSRERDPARLTVVIKPANAFGTGHHPTTAGVLRAIERLSATRRFRSGLDVGTGSGVLAIAMKLMGIGEVAAVDNDEQALDNARENAALNQVKLKFSRSPVTALHRRFELIVANILASALIEMAPALTRLLARDGRLVVQVPNAASWQFRLLGRSWNGVDVPRHLFDFRDRDMEKLLESCGFEVLRRKYFSLRDNPAGLASSLAPSLDPMARRVRRVAESGGARMAKDLAYFAMVVASLPFTIAEAACRAGSTVMIEARPR
jgi:ribosomal protein L11 methylase PrmA